MKTAACPRCRPATSLQAPVRPGRSFAGFVRWLVPGLTLVLMPKCPVCFAGYIALVSGVGLSLPVASALRTSLIVLCVASLAFLAVRALRRLMARHAIRT